MKVPSYYIENNIPKARWMYPGKAYKARWITVSRELEEAKMFIYVLNDEYVIAYRDEQLTKEIGTLKLEHFELFGHLNITEPPNYKSTFPISLTYGELLKKDKNEGSVHINILPPDPPEQYEQLTLF